MDLRMSIAIKILGNLQLQHFLETHLLFQLQMNQKPIVVRVSLVAQIVIKSRQKKSAQAMSCPSLLYLHSPRLPLALI